MLGGLVAVALFGSFSLSKAFILGVILAPTDAGLGSAVVTDTRFPQVVRQSLNVESGLNDGICVPLLLILLATVSGADGSTSCGWSPSRSATGCSAGSPPARSPRRW